ncbi:recombinase family protein [Streptomyces nitrosporeus]|uniref:Recombinase family protein n=1 Tax=Streptomyces nitrosporeus TaxID=28894 RepID=A0A5J6F7A6_9ACTN|nr:recombinase family protein [Streptomyces nitrosporeus]
MISPDGREAPALTASHSGCPVICTLSGGLSYAPGVGERVGYARCSPDEQDLAAQRGALLGLDVPEEQIYLDHGPTGTSSDRPGPAQALAAVRAGDTLVAPRLDRLARSVPGARGVKLSLGGTLYDPADPMGKMFFDILAAFAVFGAGLLRMRTREGMAVARAKVKLKGKQPKLTARRQSHLVQQHQSGEHTIAGLAELFSVSRATVYRVLDCHRNAATPSTPGGQ